MVEDFTFEERSVVPEAYAYIRECLAQGCALSELWLEELTIESGTVITLLPKSVSDEESRKFSTGGVMRWMVSQSWLTDRVQAHLKADNTNLAIFEYLLASRNDVFLKRRTNIYYLNECVYYVLFSTNADIDLIGDKIRDATGSYLFLGSLSSCPSNLFSSASSTELDLAICKTIAQRTQHLIVSAYDGEGYLIWSPGQHR